MLAVNALLHNVSNFAQEAVRSPAMEEFKANPTKDSMMDYLFNSILMRCRTVERRTSLYDRSRLADWDALPQPTSRTNSRTRRAVSLPGPEEDEPEPPTRPSRPRLGQRPPSATRSWLDGGQRRTLPVQEQAEVDDDEDDEPAPSLYRRRTSMPRSSFTSRGLQWQPSTLSRRDSAVDLDDHQQTEDKVEDVVRPPRKRAKRGPTATVTTVEAVVSRAAEEDMTGTRHKKKHKKRHRQERLEEEAEEVVQASPPKKPKKKKNKEKEKYTGACLADLAKDQDRLSKKLKKSKVAHS